jgi:hypothetical protein
MVPISLETGTPTSHYMCVKERRNRRPKVKIAVLTQDGLRAVAAYVFLHSRFGCAVQTREKRTALSLRV